MRPAPLRHVVGRVVGDQVGIGLLAQHMALMQATVPGQHVIQRRIQRPCARHDADIGDRLRRQPGREQAITHGQALSVFVHVRAGVLHAQRSEDGLLQIVFERHAAGLGHDLGRQVESGVVVADLGPRLELQAIAGRGLGQLLRRATGDADAPPFGLSHQVRDARGVRQQMMDAQRHPCGGARLDPFADGIVNRQLALVLKLQDSDGRELLGHRGQTEAGVQCERRVLFVVRLAVDLAEQDLIALGYQNGAGELFGRVQVIQPFLQLRQGLDDLDRRALGQADLVDGRRLRLRRDSLQKPGPRPGRYQAGGDERAEDPGPAARGLGNDEHETRRQTPGRTGRTMPLSPAIWDRL